jgi:hypothetical protein
MARSRKYSLVEGQPPRLELSWKGIWKEITITVDGQTVGVIPDQKALKQGRDFQLPDGDTLHVQLKTGFGSAELQVLRNGQPLPGSGSDPVQRLKMAAGVVWFIAGLNVLLGAVAVLARVETLARMGVGWPSMIEGLIYGLLAYFVGKRSIIALGLAVGLFGLDTVLVLASMVQAGGRPGVGGIVMRIFLFLPMVQGFGAIKALKARDKLMKLVQETF